MEAAGSAAAGLMLGIETSCDETAAAVVDRSGRILANVVATQIALHAQFGGVVPELASREHLRNLVPVVRTALRQAGIGYHELDAIAVTEGPGLAGALLVGIVFAKTLAFGLGRPLIAVNHLEGHIHAVLMGAPDWEGLREGRPLLALVVSGGHTHLYLARRNAAGIWSYRNVGRTVDDAAGEAYDKVAKLLGLRYPGGPWIDELAEFGDARAVPFHFGHIRSRDVAEDAGLRFDFSFSGIKTAVLRYTQTHGMGEGIEQRRAELGRRGEMKPAEARELLDRPTLDLIASFQAAVVGNLLRQTFAAAQQFGAAGVLVSGGVAANRELRRRFAQEGASRGLRVEFPALSLATDNAAMIAAAAWPKFLAGDFAADSMAAQPQMKLGA